MHQWPSVSNFGEANLISVCLSMSKNDLASGNANVFAISRALSSSRRSLKERCARYTLFIYTREGRRRGRLLYHDAHDFARGLQTGYFTVVVTLSTRFLPVPAIASISAIIANNFFVLILFCFILFIMLSSRCLLRLLSGRLSARNSPKFI